MEYSVQFSSVRPFVTPWTAACKAFLSITNFRSLPKLMAIELVTPSNNLILCHPLLFLSSIFPSIRVFSNDSFFASGGQSIGISASALVLPMNIQDWIPLGWICLIPCCPIDSWDSSSASQFKSINTLKFSFLYVPTLTSIHDYWKKHRLSRLFFQ